MGAAGRGAPRTWERSEAEAKAEVGAAGGGAHGLTPRSPALPGPQGPLPAGGHVGARRNFPGAGANFAALGGEEPGCQGVVARWSLG